MNHDFLSGGGEMAALVREYDWSRNPLGPIDGWSDELRSSLSMMLTCRFPMLIFWGDRLITFYNDAFRPSLGDNGKHPGSLGQPGEQSWAESWPVIGPMITGIMKGEPAVWFEDQKLPLYRDGKMGYAYWTYCFSPIRTGAGEIKGLLVTCAETTKTVENERQLLTMFEQAPVAIAVLDREDLRFRIANTFYGELVGRKPVDLIGKPIIEALPEIVGQGFIEVLRGVVETGKPFSASEVAAEVKFGDTPRKLFINLAFHPMREPDGTVDGVLVVAVDVTEQVTARTKTEQAEFVLRDALDLARLGMWGIDLASGKIDYSKRLREWIGYESEDLPAGSSPYVHPDDRERSRLAFERAIAPGGSGKLDEVSTIINVKTGQERIVHSIGQAVFDADGKAISIAGIIHDITEQEEVKYELEDMVAIRTRELDAALSEVASANKNLSQRNSQLLQSNEELTQFAYVASHDLQEPLRKIQLWSGIYEETTGLPEDVMEHLRKIKQSANRMKSLIEDLLDFSRIQHEDVAFREVNLNEVLASVKNDLELTIGEKNAVIEADNLPVMEGVPFQLHQLFYNLIGNALKFSRKTEPPRIQVSCMSDFSKDEDGLVKKFHISVSDNGIGIEEKYMRQVFEIFKRLHTQQDYPGTGMGLAVCKRIVENHGGEINLTSTLGEGSIFTVVLPEHQRSLT